MAPVEFADLVLKSLPSERDEALTASLLGHVDTVLHKYVTVDVRQKKTAEFADMAVDRMVHDPDQNLRIVWFRAVAGFAESPKGREAVKGLLTGTVSVPGVQLRQQDRWRLVTTLIELGDAEADRYLADEQKRDGSGEGLKFAWIAQAARPDAATKQRYFDEYLHHPERPEDWIEGSLGAFNSWNQTASTEPYLEPALDALGQIKRQRKIFFLVDWLGSFIGGQDSAAAQKLVYAYLQDRPVDADLRLKILQVVDELDRTVAIRAKYLNAP
jgi:aminopeptidase N